MKESQTFNSRGWMKIIVILIVGAGVLFVLLNISYFGKLLGFYFGKAFITDQQKQVQQVETHVNLGPDEIYIASLNIRAPIKYPESNAEAVIQKALIDGVVHYPKTAAIGDTGNTYIVGHSSDFALSKGNFKTVFALLPNIDIGAEILVSDNNSKVFKYKVYEKFVAKKTDVYLLDQNTNGKTILTLQTSYPIGTALQRYIVKSEFVKVVK